MSAKQAPRKDYEELLLSGLEDVLDHVSGRKKLQGEVYVPLQDVRRIRENLGLSQSEFCARFSIPLASLKNWEQGRRTPDQPTNVLLYLISQMPQQVGACIQRQCTDV
jgi:putative transcriptional regulator